MACARLDIEAMAEASVPPAFLYAHFMMWLARSVPSPRVFFFANRYTNRASQRVQKLWFVRCSAPASHIRANIITSLFVSALATYGIAVAFIFLSIKRCLFPNEAATSPAERVFIICVQHSQVTDRKLWSWDDSRKGEWACFLRSSGCAAHAARIVHEDTFSEVVARILVDINI